MTQTIPQFKNEPIVVLLLGFVTCGLYLIYWNIKAAEVINAVAEKEIISQPIAIFAGCCLPVNLYFYYSHFDWTSFYGFIISRIYSIT